MHDHDHEPTTCRSRTTRSGSRTTSPCTASAWTSARSGTQVVFSRLHLRRLGEELTSRYIVVGRDTLYRSRSRSPRTRAPSRSTPSALGAISTRAYGAAAVEPEDVDTGVVILTGEALRRRNAEAIAAVLAERGGELVTATAGHHMEAMLAAYGSGRGAGLLRRGLRASSTSTSAAGRRSSRCSTAAGCWPPRPCTSAAGCMPSTTTTARRGSTRRSQARRARRPRPGPRRAASARPTSTRSRRPMADSGHRRADAPTPAARRRALFLTDPLGGRAGRRRHVLRRRRRVRLRPRDTGFRRPRRPARPRAAPPGRRGRAALPAAARRRVHPGHRARRIGVQRPAQRQHRLHLRPRRAAAAPQPAGGPAPTTSSATR